MFKLKKSGFTLIEMLIVIVIIGILAAAILPQLLGAQEKAEDTARKTSLSKVQTALVSHRFSKGSYPNGCGSFDLVYNEQNLQKTADMDTLVSDPNKDWQINLSFDNTTVPLVGIDGEAGIPHPGQYGYCKITHKGNIGAGIVIVAKVATEGVANFAAPSTFAITSDTTLNDLTSNVCDSFEIAATTAAYTGQIGGDNAVAAPGADGVCEYDEGDLYYIIASS